LAQRPSILQLEHAFLSAWPGAVVRADQSWVCQFTSGFTKRANSAQSMDPEDEEGAKERLLAYAEWAKALDSTPIFRVSPLAGEGIIAALNALHWQPFDQSVVMAMQVGAAYHPRHECKFFDVSQAEWHKAQSVLNGYSVGDVGAFELLLQRISPLSKGVLVYDEEGQAAAAAMANNNAGVGVYLNVVVREDLRGKGYGRSVMQAAQNWSREAGAKWAAIQVHADNLPAISLYRSLGFDEIYRYHYRRPV
jgi:GNAT superfamily N-acetyltransferase